MKTKIPANPLNQLTHWRAFVKSEFTPPRPNINTGRDWVANGTLPGKIIGDDVYIYVERYKLGQCQQQQATITERAIAVLG